jgi:thiamine biosynthesis lipoprotein
MASAPSHPPVERARPLLGTYVSIRVGGLHGKQAHDAIDAGFYAVAKIHALMSFHEPESEASKLNRDAAREPVTVSDETYEVIRFGLEMSAASEGVFDMTVAHHLVDWEYLPRPPGAPQPDPEASWHDVELLPHRQVRFWRPLWLDFGGIAKGFAVDCAVASVLEKGATSVCVNAGGDLRIAGPLSERVLLRTAVTGDTVPVLEIENGSIASSSGREHRKVRDGLEVGPHVHGLERAAMGTQSFVSVVAKRCVVADALTKVVLARGAAAESVLLKFGAAAYLQDARGAWRVLGEKTS